VSAAGISRQALIIVGEVLKARSEGVAEKSKLYDRNFEHGYRGRG
jgi:precorrin-4/cobalt-precorrin-4 C11-methyltransferase